jgi:hypothetical protein
VNRRQDLPFAVWVLIGFVVSFVAIGGGVLLARSGDDDGDPAQEVGTDQTGSTTTTPSTTTTSTAPPTTTTTAAAAATTAPPPVEPGPGTLTVGEPDGFEWPDPDHPPFPFPAPAEVRGRVEVQGGDGDDEDDDERPETYAFTLEIEDRAATVDDVVAHLARFPAAAGWSATEPGGDDDGASFAFERDCGERCQVVVRIDVLEAERRNRGPRLEVVVTFEGG